MASSTTTAAPSRSRGFQPFGGKGRAILLEGIYKANPVTKQVLGICIFLAVTNRVANSLVMGAALTFVTAMSNLFISTLRNSIPRRIRMIAQVAIIATFVIIIDQLFRGFYWSMSKQLGPYVALIITSCVVMGRAEAYAMQNPPLPSLLDGLANGIGYAIILVLIGVVRELVGAGTILGFTILPPAWYVSNLIFLLAPGAFFTGGFLIWILETLNPTSQEPPAGGTEAKR
jgi:Na+-transporting NADH:ubiquinone oxidoreductase subunit D